LRDKLTLFVLVTLLVSTSAVAYWAWQEIGEVEISRHGLIALGLGAGFTFLLGAGLMALLFRSHHHGHDDRAHHFARDRDPGQRHD
jgi:hypothetical protein